MKATRVRRESRDGRRGLPAGEVTGLAGRQRREAPDGVWASGHESGGPARRRGARPGATAPGRTEPRARPRSLTKTRAIS